MKNFLTNILFFFIPILIVIYPLDYAMSYFLKQTNTYPGEFEVWNDIYSSEANCDIAIYGSSRAWVHISPKILSDSLHKKVYNFGLDGHNFWLQYLRHLEFLKHNKKPETIILSVDIFSLEKEENLYQPDQFLPYMLWNSNFREYTSTYVGYDKMDYYIPLIRYSKKFSTLKLIIRNITKGKPSKRYREHGFLGMDREWSNDFDNAKAKMESYEIKTDLNTIALFERFIKECKDNDIELILVYTPEFIEGQKFTSNRDEVLQMYRDFSTKYSIKLYDYSADSISFNKTYFYNTGHLNKNGAELFSRDFAHKLKQQKMK